ncbi:MAG: hypothetical protein KAX44_03200 [Candidatus Brocadiae bacterium]|nr:hypothetical protein [Candidatus Brocadiia bacterium]
MAGPWHRLGRRVGVLTLVPIAFLAAYSLFFILCALAPRSVPCISGFVGVAQMLLMLLVLALPWVWLVFWVRADRWRKTSTVSALFILLMAFAVAIVSFRAVAGRQPPTCIYGIPVFLMLLSAALVLRAHLHRKWRLEEALARTDEADPSAEPSAAESEAGPAFLR